MTYYQSSSSQFIFMNLDTILLFTNNFFNDVLDVLLKNN